MKHILAFSGSLRKGSMNSGLVRAAIDLAAGSDLKVTMEDISFVPLFNQDMEASFPTAITELKNKIRAADGILIATPEYNRSIPGVLKNMVDWTSRPYGDNAWANKTVAIMGAGGTTGTALGQSDLKKVMLYLDARVIGQPELYVHATGKFDPNGNLTDEKTKEYVKKLLDRMKSLI